VFDILSNIVRGEEGEIRRKRIGEFGGVGGGDREG